MREHRQRLARIDSEKLKHFVKQKSKGIINISEFEKGIEKRGLKFKEMFNILSAKQELVDKGHTPSRLNARVNKTKKYIGESKDVEERHLWDDECSRIKEQLVEMFNPGR